ncbi:hypothetical protein POSPLADRAFT_1151996 [Postia placenta MAD-698-R-SB12]|uniref:Uncharacterized protein n=1 Tax=Postia placenta MAD-698-R-SB12 TaxID=670580 RepID=A0A1X6MRA7_9APHY|nr:hypothetical protein POSPLADRAFT_1151996 [Postia placenta MAD-698-R-SB12]OSX58917.1 hypothetical protein POSPLADRAFT_1151996 [Postia placenta MAD-698-R-SB12]
MFDFPLSLQHHHHPAPSHNMLIPIQLILTGLLALLAALHGPDLLDVLGIDVLIDGVVTGVVVARDRTNYLVRTVVDSAVSSTVKLLDALPQATLQDCGRVDVVYVPVFVGNVSMDLDDMVCPAVWGVFMTSDIVLPAASASSSLLIEGRDASFAPLVNVVNTSQPLPWTLFTAQPASTVGVFTMPSTHPLEGITFFGLISGLLIMPVVAVAFLVKHRVTSKIRKQLNVEAGPRASPFNPAIPDTPKVIFHEPSKPHTTTSETPETFYVDLEYTPDPVEFMFVFTDVSDFLLGLVKDVVLPSSISEEDETLGNFNSFYEIMAELKLVPSVLESVDACGQQSPVLLSPSTPSNLVEDIQVSSSPIVQDNIPTTVPNTTSPAPPAASSPSPLLPAFSLSLLPGSKSLIAQPSTRSSKSWTWAIDLYLSIRSQKMQDSEPAQSASPDPTRYREMPYCRNGELKEGIVDTHVGWNEPLAFPDAAEENDPVPRSVARERLYDVMHSGVARKTSGASVEPMHNPRTRRRKRRRKGDAPNVTESSGATADSEALTTSASAPEAAQPVARVPLRQRPLIARAGLAAIRGVLVPSPRRPRASAVAPVSPVAPPPPPPRITSIVVHNAIPSSQPGLLPPRSPILPPSDDPWKPLIRSDESSSPSAASSKLPTPRVRVPPPSHEPPNTPRGPAMTVEQSLFNVPVRVVSGKRGKGKQVSQPMVFHDALDSLQELPKESIAPATM